MGSCLLRPLLPRLRLWLWPFAFLFATWMVCWHQPRQPPSVVACHEWKTLTVPREHPEVCKPQGPLFFFLGKKRRGEEREALRSKILSLRIFFVIFLPSGG